VQSSLLQDSKRAVVNEQWTWAGMDDTHSPNVARAGDSSSHMSTSTSARTLNQDNYAFSQKSDRSGQLVVQCEEREPKSAEGPPQMSGTTGNHTCCLEQGSECCESGGCAGEIGMVDTIKGAKEVLQSSKQTCKKEEACVQEMREALITNALAAAPRQLQVSTVALTCPRGASMCCSAAATLGPARASIEIVTIWLVIKRATGIRYN
jgi:hypothetical protein